MATQNVVTPRADSGVDHFSDSPQAGSVGDHFSDSPRADSVGDHFSDSPQAGSVADHFSDSPQADSVVDQVCFQRVGSEEQVSSPVPKRLPASKTRRKTELPVTNLA